MPEQAVIDFEAGQSLKQHGQNRVGWSNLLFVVTARDYAKTISQHEGSVTVDQVRLYMEGLGLQPMHSNAYGAIFTEKGWRLLHYTTSGIRSNHYRKIGVWQWVG